MRQMFRLAGVIGFTVMTLGWAAPICAAGQVQDIPGNWSSTNLRRVAVAAAQASSVCPSESGQ
jgi:hypothetical protein